jgi:tetratricopeptide (TPR) repeat protein
MGKAHQLRPEDQDLEREYQHALSEHGTKEERLEAEIFPLLLEATGRYELDDPSGAIDALNLALNKVKRVPRLSALVRYRIALVLLSTGEGKKAVHHLETALNGIRGDGQLKADVLVSYSEALLSVERVDAAAKAAASAVELDPTNPLGHANLAIARQRKGNADGAIEAFKVAFAKGLARRLSMAQFLAISSVDGLRSHPEFVPMVKSAWPRTPYPPPEQEEKQR